MPLTLLTTQDRLKTQHSVKMIIFGGVGIGKTSLLKTLDEPTLCLDFESGLLAVQDWDNGDVISIRSWSDARDIACYIGGANPAVKPDQLYGAQHYKHVCQLYGDMIDLKKYGCIFIDSATVASRLCLQWTKQQPEALSDRTGKPDLRASYGLLASEFLAWVAQFQYIPNKDVIFVAILDQKHDEFNRPFWQPQLEGSKIAHELPGLLDIVITMAGLPKDNNNDTPKRAFICQTLNPYGYLAKDRSGKLDMIEEAHLGHLLNKIKTKILNETTHHKGTATNVSLVTIPQPSN